MGDVAEPEVTEPVVTVVPEPESDEEDPVGYLDTAADPWAAV